MSKENINKETKSNYQKLNENTQAVMDFADSIPVKQSYDLKAGIKEKQKKVADLIDQGKLGNAMMLLDEIKDNKVGIEWHQSKDLGNGTRAVVRDARNVDQNNKAFKEDAGEKYAMQVLNQSRGASLLIENTNLSDQEKDKLTEKLKHCCQLATKNTDKLDHKTVQSYNTIIEDTLKEAGIENGIEKLIFAKEIGNFNDEHKHVVTLSNARGKHGKVHTVTEAEVMMNGLTKEQKTMYESIAKQKPGVIARGENMEWYNKMPEYKRKLVHDVAGKIAKGDKILPTQLLSDLPGIKNAYQKVTAVKERNSQEKSEIISKNMHSGTPATKSTVGTQKERDALVSENIKQLQSFAPPESKLHLNILNSKTPLNIGKDNFIYNQVGKAVSGLKNIVTTASPINTWAMLAGGGRDHKQFNETLEKVGKNIVGKNRGEEVSNVSKYLQQKPTLFNKIVNKLSFGGLIKTTEYKARQELKALSLTSKSNNRLASVLGSAMDAKNLLTSPAILTKGNVNMNISAAMNSVENSIKLDNGVLGVKCYKRKFKNEMPTRVEFCKSGKDRTGIVQMENSQIAINNYLCLDRKSDLAKSNYKQLAVSGHTQQLAGMQGGTIGCHSLKVFRGNCISSEQASILGIINQKSAYGNSAIKTLNNTKKVQSFRKEFQTSLEKHELGLDKEREVRKIQKVTKGHNKTLEKFKKHAVENSGKKQAPVALNKETFKENQKNAQMSK